MSSSTNVKDTSLNWDVFIAPGIPIRTNTPAPNTKETFWHPISSTLIYGKRDAVLVDTFITVKQSDDLLTDFDRLAESAKTARELYDQMLKLYPDWLDPHVLWLGARAAKDEGTVLDSVRFGSSSNTGS